MKIITPEETFVEYCLGSNQYQNNQESKSPPAVTFPKGKSLNHPKILHVQVANNQVRIPQGKRGNIEMPVSSYHEDKLLWGTFKLKPDSTFADLNAKIPIKNKIQLPGTTRVLSVLRSES